MFRKMSLSVVATLALLVLASPVMATARHVRLKHPPLPAPNLPAEVLKAIRHQFPNGEITGSWMEEAGFELEVFVSVPGSSVVEAVFQKTGTAGWRLIGFEYPVCTSSLTPKAMTAIHAKYPKASILEVEMFFDASWKYLGDQVTLRNGNQTIERFILPSGQWGKDPW
jgi:hypothetical protein